MRLLPAGPEALLLEVADLAEARAAYDTLAAATEAGRLPGVVDLVPAARTVLALLAPGVPAKGVAAGIRTVLGTSRWQTSSTSSRVHVIDVVYDGPDLAEVAGISGRSVEEVVDRHSAARWEVAFGGFAPGFAYLTSEDVAPVPRRGTPRTAVPAGSVALADRWRGIYPRSSPGGWQLVGRTDAPLWDLGRTPPALLAPGDTVRFRAVDALEPGDAADTDDAAGPVRSGSRAMEVLEPGPLATLQDRGRPGYVAVGLGTAGAADRAAHDLALRLTGCSPGAASIELLLGGLVARALDDLLVAVTGARAPITVDGRAEPSAAVVRWPRGTELRVGAPTAGLRAYLAVTGGWEAPVVLGSRSWDSLSATGPRPLRAGDVVGAGRQASRRAPTVDLAVRGAAAPDRLGEEPVVLEAVPGWRADWFDAQALDSLVTATWTVSSEVDRVGARLDGPALERSVDAELPSEGMVRGAVQVSADGRPTIFLADHPVTGGYPVVAVLAAASCDRAAQLRPGEQVRFEVGGSRRGSFVAPQGPPGRSRWCSGRASRASTMTWRETSAP